MEFTGKSIIVTGATKGIGRATAIHLAGQGAHIVAIGRDVSTAIPGRPGETVELRGRGVEGGGAWSGTSPVESCMATSLPPPAGRLPRELGCVAGGAF